VYQACIDTLSGPDENCGKRIDPDNFHTYSLFN
jgi:hypothetical protein